jgi:hypothetical protein
MILPFDVSLFVWLLDQLAELLPLDNLDYKAIEDLFARGREGVEQVGKTLQQILEDIRWKASVNKSLEPHFEHKIPYKIASILVIISLILIACTEANAAGPIIADNNPNVVEIGNPSNSIDPPFTTPKPGESPEASLTPEGFGAATVDYGRYEGSEQEANAYLVPRWQEIVDEINRLNLALPFNLKIVDISADNALIEILQTGREDDYDEGTTFTISRVPGHEGELLRATVAIANELLGTNAVSLAISVDGLPAALDAEGKVVGYVDPQTGQWTAGSRGLAPEVVPDVPQTTATPEGTATPENRFNFDLPEATLDNITNLPEAVKNQFPLETTTRPDGSTSRQVICVSDGLYVGRIQLSKNIHALVSAECWYEEDGERRSFYLPLAWTDKRVTFITGFGVGEYHPSLETADESFYLSFLEQAGYTGNGHIFIVSAEQIDPNLGVYGTFQGVGAVELSQIFIEKLFVEFGNTGNPEVLGNVMVSPDVGMVNTRNN